MLCTLTLLCTCFDCCFDYSQQLQPCEIAAAAVQKALQLYSQQQPCENCSPAVSAWCLGFSSHVGYCCMQSPQDSFECTLLLHNNSSACALQLLCLKVVSLVVEEKMLPLSMALSCVVWSSCSESALCCSSTLTTLKCSSAAAVSALTPLLHAISV